MTPWLGGLALVAAAYLSGSIPFGWIVFRVVRGGDIRDHGSGNIGATNLRRFCGWGWALSVLLLDALKGALPVALSLALPTLPWVPALCGMAALLGHCYPVFLLFRGGKAVATGLGVFTVLAPWAVLGSLGTFLALVLPTRMVSLGSLGAAATAPLWMWLFGYDPSRIVVGVAAAVLVTWRHRTNIARLLGGGEARREEKL